MLKDIEPYLTGDLASNSDVMSLGSKEKVTALQVIRDETVELQAEARAVKMENFRAMP